MGPSVLTKRFRINPIESVLIVGFALLFCHSVYELAVGYPQIELAMENHYEKSRGLASVSAGGEAADRGEAASSDQSVRPLTAQPPVLPIDPRLNEFHIELTSPDGSSIDRTIDLLQNR